jgi:membrane protein required for colicin V production
VGKAVRLSALGGLDRTLGLVFGLVRGAALVVAAYIVGGLVEPDREMARSRASGPRLTLRL